MKHHWIVRVFQIALILLIVIAGFGQAVLQLWNWLMPGIFGVPALTFWQAVGLLGLSWILFGGWRGFPGRSWHWRHRMRERWEQMTPEQREEFRKAMQSRCGRRADSSGTGPNPL
jgi:hypothetical protein